MSREKTIFQITKFIWYVLYVIEAILLLRFALKLFGANEAAAFTSFIYDLSAPLLSPFMYVFRSEWINGSAIEWSTLLAMLAYYILAVVVIKLTLLGRSVDQNEAERSLDSQDNL